MNLYFLCSFSLFPPKFCDILIIFCPGFSFVEFVISSPNSRKMDDVRICVFDFVFSFLNNGC